MINWHSDKGKGATPTQQCKQADEATINKIVCGQSVLAGGKAFLGAVKLLSRLSFDPDKSESYQSNQLRAIWRPSGQWNVINSGFNVELKRRPQF